jgi:HEAT repeat protein
LNPTDRIRAVQVLAERADSIGVLPALGHIASDDPFWGVRLEAVTALNRIRTEANRDTVKRFLLKAAADPRAAIRAAAVTNLRKFRDDDVRQALRHALSDSSYAVVTASLRSLARADSAGALPVLLAHLTVPSEENRIANAALGSIQLVDSALAVDTALRYVRYGEPVSTRLEALRILTRYVHSRAQIHDAVAALVTDRLPTVRSAAIHALGDVGVEADLPSLDGIAADGYDRAAPGAAESARKIRAGWRNSEPLTVRNLHTGVRQWFFAAPLCSSSSVFCSRPDAAGNRRPPHT